MGIKDLQNLILNDETLCAAGVQTVDLVKAAWNLQNTHQVRDCGDNHANCMRQGHVQSLMAGPNRLALVVDGEHCLDRLYGGYYSDWSCGGQWNHMVEFMSVLFSTLQQANIHTAIFLNGALEPARFPDWVSQQMKIRQNVKNVLRHMNKRGTPPPKVWWVPPTGIRSVVRLALRHLNIPVMCSVESHHQEVVGFLRENGYHGVMADHSEYCIFDPPRYFSAHMIKLTLKFTVETQEIVMDEVAKSLDLNPNRFSLMAALCGNHILTEQDLKGFHTRLIPDLNNKDKKENKVSPEKIIRAVVNYVRTLQTIDDLDSLGSEIFGSSEDERVVKLKEVVEYYNSGTEDGYKKFKPSRKKKKEGIKVEKLASETEEAIVESKQLYQSLTAGKKVGGEKVEDEEEGSDDVAAAAAKMQQMSVEDGGEGQGQHQEAVSAVAAGAATPSEQGKYPAKKNGDVKNGTKYKSLGAVIPTVNNEVLKTAAERHRQASMSPLLYQLLTTGDLKLGQLMEDEEHGELPPIHNVFLGLRKTVYAIVFNAHHTAYCRKQAEEELKATTKRLEETKKTLKKSNSTKVMLNNGQPQPEKEVLEKRLEECTKKIDELTKTMPEKGDVQVREWLPYNKYSSPEMWNQKGWTGLYRQSRGFGLAPTLRISREG